MPDGTVVAFNIGILLGFAWLDVADASEDDKLSFAGRTLYGGFRWANSESVWAWGLDHVRYAVNIAGELVVQGPIGKETYVAGFNNSLDGPYTAGIGIGELSMEIYRLFETPNGWQFIGTMEALMGYALKFLTGESHFGTVDPIVLDLDGDGLELSARSSVSPYFDIDGDGFAEQSGWTQGDDVNEIPLWQTPKWHKFPINATH